MNLTWSTSIKIPCRGWPLSPLTLSPTRVIDIHGIDGRDHKSLTHMPAECMRAVLDELVRADYRGVLTVEVFSEDDFLTSLAAIQAVTDANKPTGSVFLSLSSCPANAADGNEKKGDD